MNFLILGSGGRECAFAWKLKQSKLCEKLFIAPGNAGTQEYGTNVALKETDFESIANFCLENKVEIVVVGPEAPLVEGIYDYFQADEALKEIHIIGPSKVGATLEGSKSFAKEFMIKHKIPTAAYKEFTKENLEEGIDFIETNKPPFVLKADGLAGGKGVVILEDKTSAKQELTAMIGDAKFGDASAKVLIEQFLKGIEFSVFVLSDGENYVVLPQAKDYKRIGEGDTGLNTGGMGAISPVPFVSEKLMQKVEKETIIPTIQGLKKDNIIYKGFIYFGFMLVEDQPYIIEYNCRMGDPETQVVMPRLENDLGELFLKCAERKLDEVKVEHSKNAAATLVLVSGGYPEAYEKGKEITLPAQTESIIFHAGTTIKNNKLVTNGGRVLALTSFGKNIQEAVEKSKTTAGKVNFEGKYFRRDIGFEF